MDSDTYPEIVPDTGPLTRFVVDLEDIASSKRDIDLQSEALAIRIKRISDRCELGGMPNIIDQILRISRNPEELTVLGKGLIRVAEIIGEYDEVLKKATVLEVAEKHPSWLALALGKFEVSDDLEELIGIEAYVDNPEENR